MTTKLKRSRRLTGRQDKETVLVFGFERMSRSEALFRVVFYLKRSPAHTTAVRLIHLFHVQAEELLEAGVPFEVIRMLERRCVI